MTILALIASLVGVWVITAVVLALGVGRAIEMGQQRRPRARTRRTTGGASAAIRNVVAVATGQIPIIRIH